MVTLAEKMSISLGKKQTNQVRLIKFKGKLWILKTTK